MDLVTKKIQLGSKFDFAKNSYFRNFNIAILLFSDLNFRTKNSNKFDLFQEVFSVDFSHFSDSVAALLIHFGIPDGRIWMHFMFYTRIWKKSVTF